MKQKLHRYQTTFEDFAPDGSLMQSTEVRIVYNFTPGDPGQSFGPAEKCCPPEDAVIEIVNIHEEVTTMAGDKRWFDAAPYLFHVVEKWAEKSLIDELTENASVDLATTATAPMTNGATA